MPELPEVESLRRLLEWRVGGARIRSVSFVSPVILRSHRLTDFSDIVVHRSIRAVGRRGKYLLLSLSASERAAQEDVRVLVVHLRMRGSFQVEPLASAPGAYLCAALELDEGRVLRFYDMWRWGEWWLLETGEPPDRLRAIAQLGPEPFAPDFTPESLGRQLAVRPGAIKPLLLGQRLVAGLGNIYCDEMSFHGRGTTYCPVCQPVVAAN
jgi:formamidopyrimidine-DNA glycosylase